MSKDETFRLGERRAKVQGRKDVKQAQGGDHGRAVSGQKVVVWVSKVAHLAQTVAAWRKGKGLGEECRDLVGLAKILVEQQAKQVLTLAGDMRRSEWQIPRVN